MRLFRYLALLVLFLDLPVPVYWFILHPLNGFWRRHVRAAFWTATLGAWVLGGVFIGLFHGELIRAGGPSFPMALAGLVLIASDVILLRLASRDLGNMKLVGHAELTGAMDMITDGLYAHVRHPRYAGMIAAVAGACVLAETRFAWITGAAWLALVMASISMEEREMRNRFGAVYEEYCRRVPRFLPMRMRARRA
jgi:protein-S-isoprenylcysteine O-methyltransferase Ste14